MQLPEQIGDYPIIRFYELAAAQQLFRLLRCAIRGVRIVNLRISGSDLFRYSRAHRSLAVYLVPDQIFRTGKQIPFHNLDHRISSDCSA
jgi:hypothetical protein